MRHRHAQFSSPIQLPALLKASRQSVDRIPAAACPLCHWDATLRDLNKHTSSDETLVVTPDQFRKHLGGHMEQLALFALPRKYKDEEENAKSHEAAAMAHSDSLSRQLSMEEMSWKTNSSHGMAFDESIPDVGTIIAPRFSVHSKDLSPWSRQALDLSKCSIKPVPCTGAAVSHVCSNEGKVYLHGGMIHANTINHDIWTIEIKEEPTCYPMTTNGTAPWARLHHAALVVGNAFIVFGGSMKENDSDEIDSSLDNGLYFLNTSEALPALYQSRLTYPGTKTWSTAIIRNRPPARYGHTLTLLGTTILVFGGQTELVGRPRDAPSANSNDMYAIDLNSLQSHPDGASWETLMPNETHPNRPLGRLYHTMVSWNNNLYL